VGGTPACAHSSWYIVTLSAGGAGSGTHRDIGHSPKNDKAAITGMSALC
jgi:hypothetical protein